ncbi:MAG TPA: trypsin-like peptidase domain-containing protein, partial [Streptosporangiaceae bacterium]|nr:trypsin-like peptidase domain-containing protein [Streptosporangiaceae bacterium]
MTIFDEIQASITRLTENAGPSVAGIGQRWGTGSGIVLGAGQVLTNAHNIRGREVTVTFADGRTAEGTVAGHDFDGDLAVVQADTAQAAALPWSTGAPAVGMPVFALSNPGGRGLRVTFGTISGIDRSFRGPRGLRITGSLEHTAPLLPGSSGGPVLDAAGHLLGINTNRLGEGFYLAIPADEELRRRVDALGRGESVRPPQLGITITPGHVARRLRRAVGLPDAEGLLIRDVAEDSPAARAGLASGDLIVTAAGQPVRSVDDLSGALRAAAGTIELTVLRGTDERTIQVTFGQDG